MREVARGGVAMPTRRFQMRPLDVAELSIALDLLSEAARWEISIGLPHPWPQPFPASRILPAAERNELFVAEETPGTAIGTLTLQWEDVPFWGVRPPDAGYVHRLAVRRDRAGQNVGGRMLAWAEGEVRARGRGFVRLDCLKESSRLHRYYESFGFRRVGEVTQGGLECSLFEKALGPSG